MEKRLVLFFAITMLFMFGYSTWMQKMYPDHNKKSPKQASAPVSAPASVQKSSLSEKKEPAGDSTFETPSLTLKVNESEGAIREIALKKFKDEENRPLQLFSLPEMNGAPLAIRLLGLPYGSPNRITAAGGTLEAVSDYGKDFKVTKSLSFRSSGYGGDLDVTIENVSSAPRTVQYQLYLGSTIPQRNGIDSQYEEANFYTVVNGKKVLKHVKESKAGKSVHSEGSLEWIANKDRHFSIIVKPKDGSFDGVVEGLGKHQFQASLLSENIMVPAGGSVKQSFILYIGPNDVDELLPFGLDAIVNFGKLDIIGRAFVGGLELLHKGLKNYGLAIIFLTILINVLLFPLTRQSYMSMKRMQLVQPQLNKLREQHGKNPEKLNREMMELYKKNKVNPFGGCLPLIAQMPIFIALYVALSKTVELVNARFLWIDDLSSPDRVRLPFSLPFVGDSIHALPLIMCAGMFIQQKFTAVKVEGQDPAIEAQQKMMTVMMPVIFLFIFYGMPSGLVLYWLTNTVLMSAYQFKLKKMSPEAAKI